MAVDAKTILAKAKSYVGTKESPKNSNNVIFNTHYYGKAVSGSAYPWCCVFLWDIFRMCGASSLFYGGKKCAYTPTLANFYKSKNQWYTTPKVGDIVFYQWKTSNRICHVGIVLEVISKNKIKTIEGNTSVDNDSNGGCVMIRERTTTYVKGYGRPAYGNSTTSKEETKTETSTTYTQTAFIKDIQKVLGVTVTGKGNSATLKKTITVSTSKNKKHAVVKYIQKYLNAQGYNCGSVDGDFGNKTKNGVKAYQKKWTTKPDGIIDAKQMTWKHLLGLS